MKKKQVTIISLSLMIIMLTSLSVPAAEEESVPVMPETAYEEMISIPSDGVDVQEGYEFSYEPVSEQENAPVPDQDGSVVEGNSEENDPQISEEMPAEPDNTGTEMTDPDQAENEKAGSSEDAEFAEDAGAEDDRTETDAETEEDTAIEESGETEEAAEDEEEADEEAEETELEEELEQAAAATVSYRTHVQSVGWQGWKKNGTMSGTSGQAKRLEAIQIKVSGVKNLGIRYKTHIQSIGWESSWKTGGKTSGTSGQGKRLEAIKIQLTGSAASKYDVWYCVHAQHFGWLDWAKNGASAGTEGYAYRLEGIMIKVLPKGSKAPERKGSTTSPFYSQANGPAVNNSKTGVAYNTHVQTYGWQDYAYNGAMAGTSGQSKRLEGIHISLVNPKYSGDIQYRTHIQSIGWQGWKKNGQMSGTSGQAKRLEAIQIKLTGEMAKKYDVYYRVHAQHFGWMGWAKNGASAGTAGYSYRLEAIQIVLVNKGGSAPSKSLGGYRQTSSAPFSEVKKSEAKIKIGSIAKDLTNKTYGYIHTKYNTKAYFLHGNHFEAKINSSLYAIFFTKEWRTGMEEYLYYNADDLIFDSDKITCVGGGLGTVMNGVSGSYTVQQLASGLTAAGGKSPMVVKKSSGGTGYYISSDDYYIITFDSDGDGAYDRNLQVANSTGRGINSSTYVCLMNNAKDGLYSLAS